MFILGEDNRSYKDSSDRFTAATAKSVSEVEPGYTTVAFTTTLFVIFTYTIILGLFATKYRKYVLWPKKMLECCGMDKESLKEPMKETANDFERIQIELHNEFDTWQQLFDNFTQQYDSIYAPQHWQHRDLDNDPSSDEMQWHYADVSYELYVYQSFRDQLVIQRKMLVQMRMLQVTDQAKRVELNFIAGRNNRETKTNKYSKLNQIYF